MGGKALKVERRTQIADLIAQQRTVSNAELMERFGISIETVRRDLDYLEQQGVLRKVYGGAVVNISLNSEPEYASRARTNFREKNAIAREAVKLIRPGDTVYLGVGTTVQSMVQYMKKLGPITVFTNAMRTAVDLSEIPGCTVILPGGQVRAQELTLSGFPAEDNLRHFNILTLSICNLFVRRRENSLFCGKISETRTYATYLFSQIYD